MESDLTCDSRSNSSLACHVEVGSTKRHLGCEQRFRDADLFPRLNASGEALVRSQAGPGAGLALATCPTCRITSLEPQLYRVLLLRRLHLHLPLSERFCRCGQPLDPCCHHRAACARVGVLERRGYPLESIAVRICREGWRQGDHKHSRPATWTWQNQTWQTVGGSRWLQTAYRCSEGVQLAIDTTLVSTLHANGIPRRVGVDGVALQAARRRKERRYPELARTVWSGQVGRACRGGVWPLVAGDSVFPEFHWHTRRHVLKRP